MKAILAICLLGSLIGMSVEASPALMAFQKKVQQLLPKTSGGSPACADFSGKWKGSCTSSEGTASSAFAVSQVNCTQISFDGGYPFQIGGTHSFSEVNKYYTFTYNYTADWAAGYTTLDTRVTGFVKVLADDQPPREVRAISTLALDGAKLVLHGNYAGEKIECSYARN